MKTPLPTTNQDLVQIKYEMMFYMDLWIEGLIVLKSV